MIIKSSNTHYDAVIIGAGIGGLVCGCYLAKAGMKVLICEQHHKPGGYCTSFKRKGYTFDAAAHSFGSFRENGNMHRIFIELGIMGRISIKRYDPIDIITSPEHTITSWANTDYTIENLRTVFPKEKNISTFFDFLSTPNPPDVAALRKLTFGALLDLYFESQSLKSLLAFPVYGNGGLPPSRISAFAGAKIFTEFLIDGGYYPDGGMQMIPDTLAERFIEFGGTLSLKNAARKITVKNDRVSGVVLDDGSHVETRYVISNCDARRTFFDLLGEQYIENDFRNRIESMTETLSMFIGYFGVKSYSSPLIRPGSTLWYLPHYDLDKIYDIARYGPHCDFSKYLLRLSPDSSTILTMTNVAYKNPEYWRENKDAALNDFINSVEQTSVPSFTDLIIYREAATPYTLNRYTSNYHGAAYGWESTNNQFAISEFKKPPFAKNLFLTGHWTTYAQGISGVAFLGSDLARYLLKHSEKAKPTTLQYDSIR